MQWSLEISLMFAGVMRSGEGGCRRILDTRWVSDQRGTDILYNGGMLR
jgi:hypothetical protein